MGAGDWIDQNIFGNKSDELRNPITSFNFVLEVEGVYFLALKSVHVFSKENEYEYIREGGVNDYVHMKRKPISKPFTFQIERYVGTERFLDPLANGTELALPVLLYVYRTTARQGIFTAGDAWPARIYTFTGCVVMSKEYGELNSEKSGILTESTTIAYRELMVLTNPFNSMTEAELRSATKANPDKEIDKIYKADSKGSLKRIDKDFSKITPEKANPDKIKVYEKDEKGSLKRIDKNPELNRPPKDSSSATGKGAQMAKALSAI